MQCLFNEITPQTICKTYKWGCAWGKQPALGCILAGDPALWDRDSASLWRGERSAPHSHRGWGAAADLSGTEP